MIHWSYIRKLNTLFAISALIFFSPVFFRSSFAADMPVVDDPTCWTCHPTYVAVPSGPNTTSAVYGGLHKVIDIGCTKCHASSIVRTARINYCTNCHYGSKTGDKDLLNTQHATSSFFGNLVSDRHAINVDHQTSSQCTACHQQELTAEHYQAGRTDTKDNAINCNTCHAASFLGEEVTTNGMLRITKPTFSSPMWYAPSDRTISRIYIDAKTTALNGAEIYAQQLNGKWGLVFGRASGQTIGKWIDLPAPAKGIYTKMYATSYNYSVTSYADVPKVSLTPIGTDYQKIQAAIAARDTNCETCHNQNNHQALHTGGMSTYCLRCHKSNLVTEHTNNSTTSGKGFSCLTCHASGTADRIKLAVADNDLNCVACHNQAHNISLVKPVPGYISLYPGYQWSDPMEAVLFSGDVTAVPGYTGDSAKVIFSNRRSDVNSNDIAAYYQTQLPNKGWTLISQPSAPGSGYYTANYVYGIRSLTVRGYNTQYANGVGNLVPTGYRVEIWYK